MTEDDIRLCPTCGALPCDWTNNPYTGSISPADGATGAIRAGVEFLRSEWQIQCDEGRNDNDLSIDADQYEHVIAPMLAALTPTETGEQGK